MAETITILVDMDGRRRIVIERRSDGLFTYSYERLDYVYHSELRERLHDHQMMWVPMDAPGGLYDTQEAAERDALRLIQVRKDPA